MNGIQQKIVALNPKLGFLSQYKKGVPLELPSVAVPQIPADTTHLIVSIEAVSDLNIDQFETVVIVETKLEKAITFMNHPLASVLAVEHVHFLLVDHPSLVDQFCFFVAARPFAWWYRKENVAISSLQKEIENKIEPLRMIASDLDQGGAFLLNHYFQYFNKLVKIAKIDDVHQLYPNQPAVIIGAGPSLEDHVDDLKKYQDRALYFSGGSAIASLQQRKIGVDFLCAVDPFETHLERARYFQGYDCPCFMSPRVYPPVLDCIEGPRVHLPGVFGSDLVSQYEQILGLDSRGFPQDRGWSLVCQHAVIAEYMGCDPIVFVGVDLSYQKNKGFADGFFVEETHNKTTKPIWQEEANWLSGFAQNTDTRCYRVGQGLPIDGMKTGSLKEVLDTLPSVDKNQKIATHKVDTQPCVQIEKTLFESFLRTEKDLETQTLNPYIIEILQPMYHRYKPFFMDLITLMTNGNDDQLQWDLYKRLYQQHQQYLNWSRDHQPS